MTRQGNRRRTSRMSGLSIRLLIAAAIAAFSLITYFSSGSVNPTTGEKQHVSISPDQEIKMGLRAAPSMEQQYGGLHPDQRAQAFVKRVGQRVVANSSAKDSPYQFEFHLLADPRTINAFALPGGQVYITAALLGKLETEAQLAGILGHEVGHVIGRHGAEHLAKQKLTQGLISAVGVGVDPNAGRMAASIGQMINMKYGRGDELEADEFGLVLMSEAGYDPRAMIGVMDILEQSSGGARQPEMMSTHPNPGNRREKIRETINKIFPNGVPNGLDP